MSRIFDRPFNYLALIGAVVAAWRSPVAGAKVRSTRRPPPRSPASKAHPLLRLKAPVAEQERLKKKHFVLDPLLN